MTIIRFSQTWLLVALLCFGSTPHAGLVNITKIGTWQASGSGNDTAAPTNGPGMATGQKFVVKIQYDDASTVNTRFVPTGTVGVTTQEMSSITLDGGSNILDIFVPMEGFDGNNGMDPFIYTQNQDDHFSTGTNVAQPTVNFMLGSDVSNASNVIGIEFEGDFVTGANFNVVQLFNAAADNDAPIEEIGRVFNCIDANCNLPSTSPAMTAVDSLTDAAAIAVFDSSVTYSAAGSTQTTNLTVQSNDLGANRTDGETFLDSSWDVTGTTQPNGVDIAVQIANSGLTKTTDIVNWGVEVTELMTDLSDTAEVIVDYANSAPSSTLSATATATGYDFVYTTADNDLAINALITGFEILTSMASVNGSATDLFDDLIANGTLSLSNSVLFTAFGAGTHTLDILVKDLAQAQFNSLVSFDVNDVIPPVPVPPAFILMLTALGLLRLLAHRRLKH